MCLALVRVKQNQVPFLYCIAFRLEEEFYKQLDAIWHFRPWFQKLHKLAWETGNNATQYFNMRKHKTALQDVALYPGYTVFFDVSSAKNIPNFAGLAWLKKKSIWNVIRRNFHLGSAERSFSGVGASLSWGFKTACKWGLTSASKI